MQWSLPVQSADGTWTPGAWHEVEGEIVPCENGLHATALEHRYAAWHQWDSEHYELQFGDAVIEHGGDTERKYVGRRARLLRHIPHEDLWLQVREYVASLKDVRWFSNDGEIAPHWDVYNTWDAAGDAAGAAVRDAAWDAAGDAAWDAARDAVRDAVRAAAGDAAWDAALMARCIVAGFDADNPHYQHAVLRMDVWKAGYGLYCNYTDVAGNVRFIVYRKLSL
jgi:hypothetical protein